MTILTFAEAVRVTATDLDELRPRWYDGLDLYRLNMRTTCDCVFGQLFRSHERGLTALARHRRPDTPDETVGYRWHVAHVRASQFDCPAALWRREVLARRDADARADVRARVLAVAPTRTAWLADVAALRAESLVADPHEPHRVAGRTRGGYELVPAPAPDERGDRTVFAHLVTVGLAS